MLKCGKQKEENDNKN